jgi:hypothetical protein
MYSKWLSRSYDLESFNVTIMTLLTDLEYLYKYNPVLLSHFITSVRWFSGHNSATNTKATQTGRYSFPLYIQLLACLIYVSCVWLRIVVSSTYSMVFLFCFSSSCVSCVARFSGLSFLYCPLVFYNVYWSRRYQNSTVVITIWLTVTKYPYLKWQWIFYFLRRCFLSSITAKTLSGLDCIYE